MRRLVKALGLVTVALAAAGCGGGGDSDDALSKQELLAQGNKICREGNAVEERAFSGFESRPTAAQIEAVITDTVVPNIQHQVDEIEALGAPEGDGGQIAGILDDAQQVLDRAKADPPAFAAAELKASKGGADPFAGVADRLHAYGLTECASD